MPDESHVNNLLILRDPDLCIHTVYTETGDILSHIVICFWILHVSITTWAGYGEAFFSAEGLCFL